MVDREEQFEILEEKTIETLLDRINKENLDIGRALHMAFIKGAEALIIVEGGSNDL